MSFGTAIFLRSVTLITFVGMRPTHNGNATVCDEIYLKSSKASAALQALQYMSDRQLEDIGFTRETFVEQMKANVLAELDAADAEKFKEAPVNPNLVGAV